MENELYPIGIRLAFAVFIVVMNGRCIGVLRNDLIHDDGMSIFGKIFSVIMIVFLAMLELLIVAVSIWSIYVEVHG